METSSQLSSNKTPSKIIIRKGPGLLEPVIRKPRKSILSNNRSNHQTFKKIGNPKRYKRYTYRASSSPDFKKLPIIYEISKENEELTPELINLKKIKTKRRIEPVLIQMRKNSKSPKKTVTSIINLNDIQLFPKEKSMEGSKEGSKKNVSFSKMKNSLSKLSKYISFPKKGGKTRKIRNQN
jgi:hypothetical protein